MLVALAIAVVTLPVVVDQGGLDAAPGDASERFFGAAGEELGRSVARDGDLHLITGDGVAYVVRRGDATWTDVVELSVPGGNPASFGHGAAIDMATDGQFGIAVVSAPFDGSVASRAGSAHVFEYDPATGWAWVQSVQGQATDDLLGAGIDVHLLGDDRTANVVVAARRDPRGGHVLSWIRRAGVATTPDVIQSSQIIEAFELFGSFVALDDGIMVVGAQRGDPFGTGLLPGSAAVFEGDPAAVLAGASSMGWVETHTLSQCGVAVLPDPMPFCGTSSGEAFGLSIDIDLLDGTPEPGSPIEGIGQDVIVVGLPFQSGPGGGDAGGLAVFTRPPGGEWGLQQRLYHDDAVGTDRLGWKVGVDGRMIAASAINRNDLDGAIITFAYDGVGWNQISEGVVSGDGPPVRLGSGLAVEGTSISAGAQLDELVAPAQGSVTEYSEVLPPANFPPVAEHDEFTTWAGDDRPLTVLDNDDDPEGLEVFVSRIVTSPSDGVATVVAGGSAVSYEPDPGFVGTDVFVYEVGDGTRTATARVTVSVVPVLSVADATVGESDGTIDIAVEASAPLADGASFEVVATARTADATEFDLPLTSYAIEPGGDRATVAVSIVDDDVDEVDETFELTVRDVVGAGPPAVPATITIVDDDEPTGDDGELGPPFDPPIDTGPTTKQIQDDVDDIFRRLRDVFGELIDLLPDRDEFGDFVFANWPPELPTFDGLDWPDVCAWFDENFETVSCDFFGAEREAPSAVMDQVVMQQGTTRVVNVALNDFDPAARPIFVTAAELPAEGESLTGLASVDLDPFGNATIVAAADYVGVTSFTYDTCTSTGACATGVVTVEVTAGPPPPVARPDRIGVWLGETRPATPGRGGINLLANDDGEQLELRRFNDPDLEGHVDDLGNVNVAWSTDGSLSIENRNWEPPVPGQSDLRTYVVPYEACDVLNRCAVSTLEITKGGYGPQLNDDFITVGRRRRVEVPVLDNDQSSVRLVSVEAGPDQVGNLDPASPPTIEDDRIVLHFSTHPVVGTRITYRACFDNVETPDASDCGEADIVVAKLADRDGPTANDDTFELTRLAFAQGQLLDVIGPEGGGADTSDQPVGFRIPGGVGDRLGVTWVDDKGTPDTSDDESATFAYVTPLDQFTQADDAEFRLGSDDPLRGLLLLPLLVEEGDTTSLAPPPPSGSTAEFTYEICDVDMTTAEARAEAGLPALLDQELCDTATVTLRFTEEPPLRVDSLAGRVGLLPGSAGQWHAPGSPVPAPPISGEIRYELGTVAEILSTLSLEAEIVDTPAEDPITGRTIDPDLVGTSEVDATLVDAPGLTDEVLVQPTFDPIRPGADLYYRTTITDDLLSGSAISKLSFEPVNFHPNPTVVPARLGVEGFSSEIVFDDELWIVTPRGQYSDSSDPVVEFRSVRGQPADVGGDLYGEDLGDYRLEVRRSTPAGPIDTLRIVPDIGFEGLVLVPYEACATWTAETIGSQTLNPAIDLPYEICRGSFAFFDVDQTTEEAIAPRASAMSMPFDDTIDPLVEFTIEVPLGDVFDGENTGGTIGGEVFDAVADLFDAAGASVDARFSGDATLVLTAGVDSTGPYLDGATTLMVEASGAGAITATQTLGGFDATVGGVASVDGSLSVRLGAPGDRFHLADLPNLSGVDPVVDYDLLVGAVVDLDADVVSATPHAAARVRAPIGSGGPDIETFVVVPVSVEIPGSDDGTGRPIVLEMEGRLDAAGLRVTGAGEVPVDAVVDGFGVSNVRVDLLVTDAGTTGRIDADLDVPALEGTIAGAPSVIPLRLDLDGSAITGIASADLDGLVIGPVDTPLASVTGGQLVVTATGDVSTGDASVAVTLTADAVDLLPGNAAGTATATGVSGVVSSDGPTTLDFAGLTAGTEDYTAITTGPGTVTLGGPVDLPILVLTNVSALDVGGATVVIGRIEFFADGRVEVSDGCLAADVGLAETFGLGGILPFDVTSACLDGDVIVVEGFFDFSLMDAFPFTPTVTLGDQTVDATSDTELEENRFTFSMDAATLTPIDLGPIRVGIAGLDVDGVTADGYIEIAGYGADATGQPVFDGTFTGDVDVTADGSLDEIPFGGELGIGVSGKITVDDNGSGVLDLTIGAASRGFLGPYLELTEGTTQVRAVVTVPYDPTAPGADPISADVSLDSVDLAGVIRIPGLESTDDGGGIPVTLAYDTGSLTVTAGGGATYTAGGFTFADVVGSATVTTTGDETTMTGQLAIGSTSATVAEIVDVSTGSGVLDFDTDAATPLLRVDDVAASIPDPEFSEGDPLAAVTVEFIEIAEAGGVSVGLVEATQLDRLADRFAFGQLLPFTITGLRIDPTDPTAITTTVAGTFDASGLEAALPGDAVDVSAILGEGAVDCVGLGIDGGVDSFCFTVAIDALGDGAITPIDFGPLEVSIVGLEVGGVTGTVSFGVAGYTAGVFDGSFGGDVTVQTDLGGALTGDFAAAFDGSIEVEIDGSATLAIAGTVDAALVSDGASATANAIFQLTIARSSDGDVTVTGPVIDELELTACVELPGFSSGPDCAGVPASITKNGSIWTATVGGDGVGGLDVSVAGGAMVAEGVTGTLTVDVTDPEAPAVTGTLSATRVRGTWGDVVGVESGPVSFVFDALPSTPLLAPVTISGSLFDGTGSDPDDVLVELEVVDLSIAGDGSVTVSEIRATALDEAATAIGVADLLPFVLSGLSIAIAGDDLTAPSAVTIRAAGAFDLAPLEQFDPIVQIGDGGDDGNCDGLGVDPGEVPEFGGTFCFGLRVDADGVRPVDLGPIRLGLQRVEIGPFTFGGSIELGGFDADGAYLPLPGGADVRGTLRAAAAITDPGDVDGALIDGEIELELSGDFSTDPDGRILLQLDGAVTGGFGVGDVIEVRGATIGFGFGLRLDTSGGVELELLSGELRSLEADVLRVSVPGAFTVQALEPTFFPSEGVLVEVPSFDDGGKVGIHFGAPPDPNADGEPVESDNPLDGWGGDVAGFQVDLDGSIRLLPGFGVNLTAGASGFPDYLPITITELGMVFGDDAAAQLAAGNPVDLDEVLGQLGLRGSMSLSGTTDLPINASVDGLEIDIGKLRDWFTTLAEGGTPGFEDFFITNLDALFFGVDELGIGPVTVSGGLGLGVAPTADGPKFWGRIVGGFTYQGYGFGVDLLVSEYGPLSMDVTAPAAMVLGQTGIVVAVNQAGVIFNTSPPPVCTTVVDGELDCEDGTSPADAAAFRASDGYETSSDIGLAIQALSLSPSPAILPSSFGVFVTGQVSHLAVQAFAGGEIELGIFFEQPTPDALLPGVKMIGRGDVNFLGMSLANLVLYADYGDPLAPAWTIAGGIADGGDLLDLLFPIGLQAGLTLDTDGLAVATVLGMRELLVQLTTAAATSPTLQAVLAGPLDDLAEKLRKDPNSWLRSLLFGEVDDDEIDADGIAAAFLAALVPPGETVIVDPDVTGTRQLYDNLAADGERLLGAVELSVALLGELLDAAVLDQRPLGPGDLPLPLSPEEQGAAAAQVIDVIREVLAEGPDAARAAARVIYDVANPAVVGQSQIQFELFDIPVGEPVADSLVLLSKDGIVVDFDGSIAKLTAATASFINAAGTVLIPLTFVAADQTNFGLSFPFRIDEYLDGGGGDVFDPTSGLWSVSTGSDLYLAGMRVSSADGLIVPGDSATQLMAWELANTDVEGVQRRIPETGGPVDTPVRSRLEDAGGIYAVGELAVPELLADPLGWLDDVQGLLAEIPDDPIELLGYLGGAPDVLLATRPGGQFELFAPTPILDSGADPTDPASWDWSDGPYVEAGVGIDLLGYRVADGGFQFVNVGTTTEPDWVVAASLELPFLNGPLQAQIENVALGLRDGVDAAEATLDDIVRWPAIAIDQQITVGDVRNMLDGLGIDDVVPVAVDDDASVTIRGFSPQHHLTADDPASVAANDPIRVTGGFQVVLDGSIDGIVDDGRIEISLGFGTGGLDPRPSFVTASFTAGLLDLGGVVLSDAELTASYDGLVTPAAIDLIVDATLTIPALDRSIVVQGSLADGVLDATFEQPIAVGLLTLREPGGADGPDVTLRRVGSRSWRVELDADVMISGWTGSATIDTIVGGGDSTIAVELDGFGRSGVALDGSVSLVLRPPSGPRGEDPGGFTLELAGGRVSVPAIGMNDVGVSGRITESGIESMRVSGIGFTMVPGVEVACGDLGFSLVGSTFRLNGSAGVIVAGLDPIGSSGSTGGGGRGGPSRTCVHDGLDVTVSLGGNGLGSLTVDDVPAFRVRGVKIDADAASVVRDASGTTVRLGGSLGVFGDAMDLAAAARLSVGSDGLTGSLALAGSIPDLYGWTVEGSLRLDVQPGATRFGLTGSVSPPYVDGALVVGPNTWIGLGSTPQVSIELIADELTFAGNALEIDGALRVERVGSALALRIDDASFGVPQFGSVSADLIEVTSQGRIDVDDLRIDTIGTSELRLVGLFVDLTRSSSGAVTFRLHGGVVTGTALNGREVAVTPTNGVTLSFGSTTGLQRNFTMPGLDLGPAFTWPSIPVRIEASSSAVELSQRSGVTATLLGADVDLDDLLFRWQSTPSGSGTVTVGGTVSTGGGPNDGVTVVGRRLRGSFSLSNAGPALRLDLAEPRTIGLSPLPNVIVDGWIQSDGRFELSGSWFASIPGQSVSGTLTLGFDEDGPRFDFSGSASGALTGSARGAMGANNVIVITVYQDARFRRPIGTFQIPPTTPFIPPAETTPPEFGSIPEDGVEVVVPSSAPDEVRIYFLEVASLTVSGASASSVSCSPDDGSFFPVGETTPVVCAVTNAGGMAVAAFNVTVVRELEIAANPIGVLVPTGAGEEPAASGEEGTITLSPGGLVLFTGSADPGSNGAVSLRSDRVELGRFRADEDGRWEVRAEIPNSLELGEHTLVVDRVIDGVRRLDHIPIVVADAPMTPTRELPATGGGASPAPWAALAVLAGLLLWLVSRSDGRRRTST